MHGIGTAFVDRTDGDGLLRPEVAGGVGRACREEKLGLGDEGRIEEDVA